jgi:hypothetical protein
MERFHDSQIVHTNRNPAMVGRVAPRAPRLPTRVPFNAGPRITHHASRITNHVTPQKRNIS